MKEKLFFGGLLLFISTTVFGQLALANLSRQNYALESIGQNTMTFTFAQADTVKVKAAVEALFTAMVDKNLESLRELTFEKLDYGHSSGTLENQSQFIDAVMNGSFDYISIEPEQQRITLSGDTAIVRHIFVSEGINDGEPTDVRIGNLMTFQKQKGNWKLLARQAYKL